MVPSQVPGREEFTDFVLAESVGLHRTMDETATSSTFVLRHYSRCKMISTHGNIVLKKMFDGAVNICFLYLKGILLLLTLLSLAVFPWPRCTSIF